MQHCRRRLDNVLGGLSSAAEAVVPGHGEVLVAAAAVFQLEHLTGDDGVLLGDAGTKKTSKEQAVPFTAWSSSSEADLKDLVSFGTSLCVCVCPTKR